MKKVWLFSRLSEFTDNESVKRTMDIKHDIVIPEIDKNLIYFKWEVPEDITSDTLTLTCILMIDYPDVLDSIPEDVIRAFIVKVVVYENGFDWYLRFSPDSPPTTLNIEGNRKKSAKVSADCSQQHRLLSNMGRTNLYFSFKVNFDQAEAYRKSTDQYLRAKQWEDLTVEVFI